MKHTKAYCVVNNVSDRHCIIHLYAELKDYKL